MDTNVSDVSLAERSKAPDSSSGGAIRVGSNPTADILHQFFWKAVDFEPFRYYPNRCHIHTKVSVEWHCVRVVKELDLNSNGLCPHRFEPCRCRFCGL